MNETQAELIGFNFGLFFAFSAEDLFLQYIAPIMLKDPTILTPTINLGISLVSILAFVGSLLALYKVIKNIQWTRENRRSIFKNYMIKNVVTWFISLVGFYFLSRITFG